MEYPVEVSSLSASYIFIYYTRTTQYFIYKVCCRKGVKDEYWNRHF